MKLIVYDFDGTIYDGDSSKDFYLFCFKKKKSICKYWIKQFFTFALYILKLKSKTELKEAFFIFLKDFKDIDKLIEEFWNKNFCKIKKWYLIKQHNDDVIISASPEFLLEIPCKKLNVKELIGSKVDIKTGKFFEKNCYGEEKVRRFKQKYPNATITEIYTDSKSDLPLIKISKASFIVKKDKVIPYFK